jgi:hypothetical protein
MDSHLTMPIRRGKANPAPVCTAPPEGGAGTRTGCFAPCIDRVSHGKSVATSSLQAAPAAGTTDNKEIR